MMRWLLMGLVTTAALALLSRLIARFAVVKRKGLEVHRLTATGTMSWTVLFLAFGMSVVIWLASYVRDVSGVLAILMCVLYFLFVAVLAALLLFHHVFWTLDGLGSWDPWRKGRFVRWGDVTQIRRLPVLGLMMVYDKQSAIIFSTYFHGGADLSNFLRSRGLGSPA